MKKLILFIGLVIITTLNTCSDNPINGDDNIPPGRRDYTWKADTLFTEDWIGITQLWGSSPNDIWAVAVGTSYKDCLWHYDGVKWTKSDQWLSSSLETIFGFSANDIWAGDSFNTIWKYDGNNWYKFQELSLSGYDIIIIADIYGTASNNLYAVGSADNYDGSGYKGIILKYNGTDWKYLNIPNIKVGFNEIEKINNGEYLISATNFDNGFLEKIFVFDGNSKLKEIYSDYNWPGLYQMNGEVYITINNRIYKYKNSRLELWKEFPGTSYYGTVLGKSEKDFFGAGYEGVLHYNGNDLQTLYQAQLNLVGVLIFEKDVFFSGYDSETKLNVMIRGTLKNE